jgi:hypothetical protein
MADHFIVLRGMGLEGACFDNCYSLHGGVCAMEATLRQDAMAETYCDTELLIYNTVHEFVRTYGGRFEDLVEYAGICFVKAYHKYDPTKAKFSTWLRWVVWKNLQELYRQRARHNGKVVFIDLDQELYLAPPTFNRLLFLDSLSDDARLVVSVALDTHWQTPDPKAIRSLIREYLRQPAIGWSGQRVRESFKEVCMALAALP